MKIRYKIVQIIAFVAFIGAGYSCSDEFYTEDAGSKITPDQHFNTQDELGNSINGAYIPLQTAFPKLLLLDGLRSDLMDITDKSDVYMREINDQNFSLDNPYIDGSDYYKTIINCNEIIKNMDQVWVKDPIDLQQVPLLAKGALYNIKAMCYLTLVRLYGKAALINDNMSSLEPTQNFLNKRDMLDTMINQLKPYVFTSTLLTEIRFAVPNTKLLIGEMYLENQQYDSAVYYLKLGCESYGNNSNTLKVSKYSRETWKEIFYYDGYGIENLDLVTFDSKKDQYNAFTGWTINYMVKPTSIILDMYSSQIPNKGKGDVYRGLNITVDTLPGTTDVFYVSKYNLIAAEPYSAYIITQRAADMHLLLAEAYNQLGDTAKALALVNTGIKNLKPTPPGFSKWTNNIGIRTRVALKPRIVPADVSDVKKYVEDIIMDERMMELAYEGKRWFDLVRVAERRNDPEYLAGKVASKFSDATKRAEIFTKLKSPANWYLPVK